jgi:hypothetical protein
MAGLRPAFSLTAGSLASDSSSSVVGPSRFVVERSLDIPIDGLRVMLAESAGVVPGDPVQLDLGDEDGKERVFTGSVAELRPRLGGCGLFCVGTMLALVDLRVSSFYQGQSAGAVVRDLIGQASLDEGDIADGIDLPRFAVDRRASAYAQLLHLAVRLGYSLFSDREGKVHFRGLGSAANLDSSDGALGGLASAAAGAASALGLSSSGTFRYGKHLLAAAGHLRPPFSRTLVVGSESPMSGQGEDKSFWLTVTDTDFDASSGDGDELLVIDTAARTKDMAARFAAGYASSFGQRSREIRLTVLGMPALELGDATGAADAPEAGLNASGFVKALRHRFSVQEGFQTDITVAVDGGA